MEGQFFKSYFFPAKNKRRIICLVAGYRGKIAGYKKLIRHLNEKGYSVAAYEHSPAVLRNGNPEDLIQLIDGIAKDFSQKSSGYSEKICVGVSVGAGICINLHSKLPDINRGIYAAAGISAAKSVFHSPLFFRARKSFLKNGVNEKKLFESWKDLEIVPENAPNKQVPFIIVLGQRDLLAKFPEAKNTFAAWQKAGVPIKIISRPHAGHSGAIRWLKRNLAVSDDLL